MNTKASSISHVITDLVVWVMVGNSLQSRKQFDSGTSVTKGEARCPLEVFRI